MVKKPDELECWQLADALRSEVIAICAQDPAQNHWRFCDGFTDAAGSVCRNISEGYGRYHSTYIVQFFGYALASLQEVIDYLHESGTRKYIDSQRLEKDLDLAEHTKATTLKFMRFHQRKLERERQQKRASRRKT